MSPRQFGKVDASTSWACPHCPHRHAPGSWCPPAGVWLVLAICQHCNPKTGVYCETHRDRSMPRLQLVDTIPAPPGDDDEYRRRIGESGAA